MRKLTLHLAAGILAGLAIASPAADSAAGPSGQAAHLNRLVDMPEKPWTQLLAQNALDLSPGEIYRLTFWAKASQPLVLRVLTKIDQPPWTGLQEQKLDLGTAWEKHEVLLQSDAAEPGHTRLEFRYGGPEAGEIWIADVSLLPDGNDTAPNRIQNPRFEEALTHWYTEGLRPGQFVIETAPVSQP